MILEIKTGKFFTAATRPPCIEELAEFFAFDFDTVSTAIFPMDSRPEGLAYAMPSAMHRFQFAHSVDIDGS
jgi:hypothetical protein